MRRVVSKKPIYFLVFLYILLLLPYIGFVPFWDGGTFFNSLISVIKNNSSLLDYSAWGHPCILYFLYSSLFQRLDVGNTYLLNFSNILLGSLGIFFFYRLLKSIFYQEKYQSELVLVSALLAFYPVFTISTLNFNLDFGLVCFYIIFLSFLTSEANWFPILVSSLFLIFTKEPGIVLYFISTVFYLIFFIFRKDSRFRSKIRKAVFKFYLLIPILLYINYSLYKELILEQKSNWAGGGKDLINVVKRLFVFDLFDRTFLTYVVEIFVMNFNWIISVFVVSFVSFRLFSIIFNQKIVKGQTDHQKISLILWSFFPITYIYTSFKTIVNPRYFLPLHPLLLIIFYYSLVTLIQKQRIRKLILVGILLLVFLSNLRTLDPVSRKIFGTFNFGKHKMLFMTSITKEVPTYARDQAVYNLEATQLHYLFNRAYREIQSTPNTYILKYSGTDWGNLYSPLTRNSYKRTFKNNRQTMIPHYSDFYIDFITGHNVSERERERIPKIFPKPETMYYLSVPFFKDSERSLMTFLNFLKMHGFNYRIEEIKTCQNLGYSLKVFKMVLVH